MSAAYLVSYGLVFKELSHWLLVWTKVKIY